MKDPKPMRPRAESSGSWEEITESHSLQSYPPAFRAIEVVIRWLAFTPSGTLVAALLGAHVGAALTWLSHHLWHWIR